MNILNILCLMFKCKMKTCPQTFYGLYSLKPPNKYNTRSEGILVEPLCRTKFEQFRILYRAPHLWNKLIWPKTNISSTKSFQCFKRKVKALIMKMNSESIDSFF